MKRKICNMIIFIILIMCVVIGFFYFKNYFLGYTTGYLSAVRADGTVYYEDILKRKGKPNNEKRKNMWRYAYYDDCIIIYNEDDCLMSVQIISSKVRYGLWNVGIGDNRDKIKRAYHNISGIKDLSENEEGYIDNGLWVVYHFNQYNIVDKIIISYGP